MSKNSTLRFWQLLKEEHSISDEFLHTIPFEKKLEPKKEAEFSLIIDNLGDILPPKEISADAWFPEVLDALGNVRKLLLTNQIETDDIESIIYELENFHYWLQILP